MPQQTSVACSMIEREVGFREKGILGRAVEDTGGSGVMLYVQYAGAPCEVFTRSSPGRAVKPVARQSVERGQIVRNCMIIFRRFP